jgi:hypothetical protein
MGGRWSKLDGSDLSALWGVGNVWGRVLIQGRSAVGVGVGTGLIMGRKRVFHQMSDVCAHQRVIG